MSDIQTGAEKSAPTFCIMDGLPLDMKEIVKYDKLIDDIAGVSFHNAPYLLQELLKAKDIVSRHRANIIYELGRAKDEAKKIWSIAKIDRAPIELAKRNVKVSDGNRESYADMDAEYLAAKNTVSYFEALLEYLFNKVMKFQSAHQDVQIMLKNMHEPSGPVTSMGDE